MWKQALLHLTSGTKTVLTWLSQVSDSGMLLAAEFIVFDRGRCDMNIDGVEQRSGNAVAVIFNLLR